MIGWSQESIHAYSKRYLVVPSAMTVSEAFFQIAAGAHLVKIRGFDLDFVKRLRLAAAFDYCPIFVSGGMSIERIPDAFNAGAIMVSAGFDMTLKGYESNVSAGVVADVMRNYVEATQQARNQQYPELAAAATEEDQVWLDALPHFAPFKQKE